MGKFLVRKDHLNYSDALRQRQRKWKERVESSYILQGRLKGLTELDTLSKGKDFHLTGTGRQK